MKNLLLWMLLWGCTEPKKYTLGQAEAGQACKRVSDCVAGFKCKNKVCVTVLTTEPPPQRGAACQADDDCGDKLVCGRQAVCTLTLGVDAGESCG